MPQQNVELVFDTKRTPAMVIQEFSVKSHKQIGDVYFNELEDLNPNTGVSILLSKSNDHSFFRCTFILVMQE